MQEGNNYEWALSNLVTTIGADRAVVFQFTEDYTGGTFIASSGAPIPGSTPPTINWQQCTVMDSLLDEEYWSLEDKDTITSTTHRALVDSLCVRSYLYSTIKVLGIVWGVVGVHNINSPRKWSPDDKSLLQTTALHISGSLLKEALVENISLHSKIKKSKMLLQKVIDSTPVYLGIKDDTGKFILVNKALSEAAGYTSPKDMVGKVEWGDYFPATSIEEEGSVLATGETVISLSSKGKDRYFTVHRLFVPGDNVLEPMVVSTLIDITELAVITKRLEDFTRIASHDLQEPLRTITSFLGLLKKRHGSEVSLAALHYVDTAIDASKRMGELLTDLLEYSRLGSKTKSMKWAPLSDVLMKALRNLSGKLVFDVCPTIMYDPNGFPEVWGDEVQLIACLQNVLSNAIKFGEGAPIEITHTVTDTHWVISVADHGVGVPEGMELAIFRPFKRAQSKFEGTGMGLAIVEKVAHIHQGSAWVTATPGGGATVHVSIKRHEH